MYNNSKFVVEDKKQLLSFINEFPLGLIIIPVDGNYPEISAIPFLIYEEGGEIFLRSHVMKNASHYDAILKQDKITVVFQGPQAYISASWYTQPVQASTWNYTLVQARGTLRHMNDNELLQNLKDLTTRFEGENSAASFSQLTSDYIEKMLPHIAGIEIKITSLSGVFKLSQNKDEVTRMQIIEKLETRNQQMDKLLSNVMKKTK